MNLNPIGSNMTELVLGDGLRVLFSYKTPVAAQVYGAEGWKNFKTSTKWSNTTSRHINKYFSGLSRPVHERSQEFFDGLVAGVK